MKCICQNPGFKILIILTGIFLSGAIMFPVSGETQAEVANYEIRSNVENASVYFDDVFAGSIEKGSLMVPAETSNKPVYHLLRIEAPGYSTYNETILQAPKPGKSNVYRGILTLLPPQSIGTVSLAISPPGGQVFVEGTFAGTVDQSGIFTLRDIPAGYQIVQVSLPGYKDWVDRVFVEANMNTKVRVSLTPVTTGPMQVTSQPSGANVQMNGAPVGITPVTIPDLPAGKVQVTISLPGYQDFSAETSIIAGENVSVSGTLTALVTSTPEPIPQTPESTPQPEPTQASAGLLSIGAALSALVLFQKKR
ncbi:hypothetical protein DLD82_09500 [Methanospirillum stamsii]|uniref:PEGA domain-containing protein n=2 Tax=Methanospirillum stamsii TaxID=1277351 RepID=A0A2V2MZB0_9EURY|nr:hypothetical protein DLD82_09500 [Methanospirillum stamsii]